MHSGGDKANSPIVKIGILKKLLGKITLFFYGKLGKLNFIIKIIGNDVSKYVFKIFNFNYDFKRIILYL